MPRDEVLKLWQARPFRPFRLVTIADETIDVWHPNLMLVAGNMLTIGQPDSDGPPPLAEGGVWLEFDDIRRIEPLQMARDGAG